VSYEKYLQALVDPALGTNVHNRPYKLCAVMELGVLGDPIPDPDGWAKQSLEHITGLNPGMEV
jgi:hypothetical protein